MMLRKIITTTRAVESITAHTIPIVIRSGCNSGNGVRMGIGMRIGRMSTGSSQTFTCRMHGQRYVSSLQDLSRMEGYYDSQHNNSNNSSSSSNNSNSKNEEGSQSNSSSRASFRSIPVHSSILTYIESIGVGLRPMHRKIPKKNKKNNNSKKSRATRGEDPKLLTPAQEDWLLKERRRGRGDAVTSKHGGMNRASTVRAGKDEKETKNLPQLLHSSMWLPPPPFSSVLGLDRHRRRGDDDVTNLGHRIIRLPVKVLGSAGSIHEELPRSTKGIPEIAIVGRSNVGKSTLLNALLYGNQFQTNNTNNSTTTTTTMVPQTRKFVRGKTPEGAKLPKGVKATVSSKPGETKKITFYQLSSKIVMDNHDDDKTDHEPKHKPQTEKVSLILADLPGYGFAHASQEKASEWNELIHNYLLDGGKRKKSLKRILLLIDARHGMKKADLEFLNVLQDGLKSRSKNTDGNSESTNDRRTDLPPIQIVLTKSDLVTQKDLARRVVQVRQQLSDALLREPSALPVMLVSAKAGLGFNNARSTGGADGAPLRARGGILELQRELAALAPQIRYGK